MDTATFLIERRKIQEQMAEKRLQTISGPSGEDRNPVYEHFADLLTGIVGGAASQSMVSQWLRGALLSVPMRYAFRSLGRLVSRRLFTPGKFRKNGQDKQPD